MINCIGNLGGFVCPSMVGWIKDATGGFAGTLYVLAATAAASAVIEPIKSRRVRRTRREGSRRAHDRVHNQALYGEWLYNSVPAGFRRMRREDRAAGSATKE